MFTGIIQELGIIKNIERRNNLLRLGIFVSFADSVKIGDSICVNGVCLTVAEIDCGIMYFDAASQTQKDTNLGNLKLKEKVNLEQALNVEDKIGGHFVTGHIDTIGKIKNIRVYGQEAYFEISIPIEFIKGLVLKGSVAVDGISLTVAELKRDSFLVNVIPYTLKSTILNDRKIGDIVNIELDILGKYSLQCSPSKITEDFLKEHGF